MPGPSLEFTGVTAENPTTHVSEVSGTSMLSAFSETVAEIREAGAVLLSSLCLVSVLEGADMALLPVGSLEIDSSSLERGVSRRFEPFSGRLLCPAEGSWTAPTGPGHHDAHPGPIYIKIRHTQCWDLVPTIGYVAGRDHCGRGSFLGHSGGPRDHEEVRFKRTYEYITQNQSKAIRNKLI